MNGFYDAISYPFGMLLGFFYHIFNNNYAVALIVFTVLFKIVLLPTSISQQKSQAKTQRTQAKLAKIRKKYENDKQKMNEEMQKFYQQEGFGSMTGGCGSLLIQFPIIIGLYGAIYKPLTFILKLPQSTIDTLIDAGKKINVFSGIKNSRMLELQLMQHVDEIQKASPNVSSSVFDKIHNFDYTIFGLQLNITPNSPGASKMLLLVPAAAFAFAMLTAVYTFLRQKKQNPEMAKNPATGCMMLFMPFMSLWLAYSFPVGIGIYWALNSLLSFLQMLLLNHTHSPQKVLAKMMVKETIERRSKEESVKVNTKLLNNED